MAIGTKDMGKLFNLMSWVELSEAAHYLSRLIDQAVAQEDILRLALEGHLTLSVRFTTPVTVRCGKTVLQNEAECVTVPTFDGAGVVVTKGTVLPGTGQVIVFDETIRTICDVWDLPMIGGERLTVENEYERLNFREMPEVYNLEGTFVTGSPGTYCKLLERFEKGRGPVNQPYHFSNFYPAAELPNDSTLVLRTEVLREFAGRVTPITPPTRDRVVGARERATLLTVVAALARIARVDITKPSSAAATIESETERMGTRVAARTIENHLKLIPEALETRGR